MSLFLYGSSGDTRAELGNPDEAEYSADDIRRARTRATNLINSYIQKAYPSNVPFASGDVPDFLDVLADDLSVYYAKRSKHQGPAPLSDEIKEEYYDRSVKLLKLISTGEIEIPELEGKQGDSIIANRKDYTPICDVDGELDQKIDPDLLSDISDDRSD